MDLTRHCIKNSRQRRSARSPMCTSALLLSACGGGSGSSNADFQGFPPSYAAPNGNYVPPEAEDPNYEALLTPYTTPYWVAALEMDQREMHVTPMLEDFERVIEYIFPDTQPA